MKTQEYLVTLNVPPSVEEAVVDCLLTFETEDGFSSFPISAHDHKNLNLSIAEQVAGRQDQIRFQMYIPEQDLPVLLDKLKKEFSGSGIHYWVLPVIENGSL
jgi:hypothetical protein